MTLGRERQSKKEELSSRPPLLGLERDPQGLWAVKAGVKGIPPEGWWSGVIRAQLRQVVVKGYCVGRWGMLAVGGRGPGDHSPALTACLRHAQKGLPQSQKQLSCKGVQMLTLKFLQKTPQP